MIKVVNKIQCCGCQACAEKCPKSCISLYEDEEGFMYPRVDTAICINCHICEKVCPIINQDIERVPLAVYATINNHEDIRLDSSSGGVFTPLAEAIIKQGGVVFGAKWNSQWKVEHDFTDTIDGLKYFRGSKYVQSDINGSYSKVDYFLKQGRKVLFSGTPCQIAGLRHFLKKDHENLLLVDIICHGVPSPGVFRQYLKELQESVRIKNKGKKLVLSRINFRDKQKGWNNYHCTFTFSHFSNETENDYQISTPSMENVYFRGFNSDLFSRPSCNTCQFRGLRSGSDITLGDFWGISYVIPEINDDKGVSAVLINTNKGQNLFNQLDIKTYKSTYDTICWYNNSVVESDLPHPRRDDFFTHGNMSVHERVYAYCWPTKKERLLSTIKSVIKAILR